MQNKQIFQIRNQIPGASSGQRRSSTDSALKMHSLVNELNEASDAYYNKGESFMSDREYDAKFDELKELEQASGTYLPNSPTHNVGAPVTGELPRFKHPYPALSLDKTKDIDKFVNTFREGVEAAYSDTGETDDGVVLMWKLDGSTVCMYYRDGKLDKLVTRGNGEIGVEITHNAKAIKGVPLTIPVDGEVVVRGEAVISYNDFNTLNSQLSDEDQFSNPRNLSGPSIQLLDPEEAARRHVVVKAFNLVKYAPTTVMNEGIPHRFSARLDRLDELGFTTVERMHVSVSELRDAIKTMTDSVQNYPYAVDGLVAALNNYDYALSLGVTDHHPNVLQGYALKWADDAVQTTLREIEWSPSRTGRLNPVAIFDPVELAGAEVSRASLHNLSVMRHMNIKVGDKIGVYRSNLVIPYVAENYDKDNHPNLYGSSTYVVNLIGCCPTCGSQAQVVRSKAGIETVYCLNEDCPEKLIGKLVNFCSRDAMDIQGMSEETIKKLVDNGFIKEYADFFYLKDKPEIASLSGFGQVSWNNMCQAAEKARSTDFVRFIVALSIPDIGKGQAKTLLKYINEHYDELRPKTQIDVYNPVGILIYMGQSNFDFAKINGFGDITARGLRAWIWNHMLWDTPEARVYSAVNFTDVRPQKVNNASPVSGKSFCITGKLNQFANRQELVDKIESLGGKWVDSVSSKTDYLINNDVTSTSGKNKKAKELNIPIISEADFVNMTE